MTDAEKISLFWPMILSAIFFIGWLIRLEASVKQAKKDIDKNEGKIEQVFDLHTTLSEKISNGLSGVQISLARIEGALHLKKED